MKRIFALALAGALSLSLVACGEKVGPGEPVPSPDITAAPEVSAPAESEKPEVSAPVESEKPVESAPVESEKPAESAKPAESEKPAESAKPVESAKPAESAKPVESAKPAESEQPSATPAPSEEPVAEFDPKDVYNAVKSAGASGQYDASSMLSVFYDLSAADLEWFYLGMPSMSSNIEEIFVAHAKDGKVEAAKSACQTRLEDLKSDAETYPETGTYVSDAKIETVGNWVLLYVGPNASTAVKNFQDSLIAVCG